MRRGWYVPIAVFACLASVFAAVASSAPRSAVANRCTGYQLHAYFVSDQQTENVDCHLADQYTDALILHHLVATGWSCSERYDRRWTFAHCHEVANSHVWFAPTWYHLEPF